MLPVQNATTLRMTLPDRGTPPAAPAPTPSPMQGHGVSGSVPLAARQQIRMTDPAAQQAVIELLSGQGVQADGGLPATGRADLPFQLALQVRNRAVAAYEQMMGMQF